jgi:hypothetical protein
MDEIEVVFPVPDEAQIVVAHDTEIIKRKTGKG